MNVTGMTRERAIELLHEERQGQVMNEATDYLHELSRMNNGALETMLSDDRDMVVIDDGAIYTMTQKGRKEYQRGL